MPTELFKIVDSIPEFDLIIDTENKINHNRICRLMELTPVFEEIYCCSNDLKIPILDVYILLSQNMLRHLSKYLLVKSLFKRIRLIRKLSKKTSLDLNSKKDNLFIDYMIEKNSKISEDSIIQSNDRLISSFFFDSKNDCERYLLEINPNFNIPFIKKILLNENIKLIKVEVVETKVLHKLDVNWLKFNSNSTSYDYDERILNYLKGKHTENPIFEILFQGKYKIISQDYF